MNRMHSLPCHLNVNFEMKSGTVSRFKAIAPYPTLQSPTHSSWYANALFIKFLLILFFIPTCTVAQGTEVNKKKEAAVKAAYLVNFPKFVTYPDQAFSDKSAPFIIGVMGDARLTTILKKVVQGKKVRNRKLIVKQISSDADGKYVPSLKQCHIFFIGKKESKHINTLNEQLKTIHVLTVSDSKGFCDKGGKMEFKIKGGRIALRINLAATTTSKLKISSKLLRLAEVIKK